MIQFLSEPLLLKAAILHSKKLPEALEVSIYGYTERNQQKQACFTQEEPASLQSHVAVKRNQPGTCDSGPCSHMTSSSATLSVSQNMGDMSSYAFPYTIATLAGHSHYTYVYIYNSKCLLLLAYI